VNVPHETQNMTDIAAQILFSEARARLNAILSMIREFNEISKALVELGYGHFEGGHTRTIPELGLDGDHNHTVRNCELLDKAAALGRMRVNERESRPIERMPLRAERLRLGEESGWK